MVEKKKSVKLQLQSNGLATEETSQIIMGIKQWCNKRDEPTQNGNKTMVAKKKSAKS